MTLDEARNAMEIGAQYTKEGVSCPCCGRLVKIYRRKINASQARSLIWLVRHQIRSKERWVDVPRVAPKFVISNRELSRLELWRLVESKHNEDETKRNSGILSTTRLGADFVRGSTRVPKAAFILLGRVVGMSDADISIEEALGDKFNYRELMTS